METITLDESTEREEGEIVDDDLEAISDDSIIAIPKMGKFISHKESLRPLSLSSVSDLEAVEYQPTTNFKKKTRRKSTPVCKRRRISKHHSCKSRSESSSDSDENVSITKRLLKEAIRIDTKESHNKSLRTRLKGMVGERDDEIFDMHQKNKLLEDEWPQALESIFSEEKIVADLPKTLNDEDKECGETLDQDHELIQLRLEALKTAVINKFEHRKKKKLGQNIEQKPNHLETNKENSSGNVITETVNSTVNLESNENRFNDIEEDEDEDIMRAVLLASIAKKITNNSPSTKPKRSAINSETHISDPSKHSSSVVNSQKKTDLTPTKPVPFIISVNNSDSDSDNSIKEENEKSVKKSEKKVHAESGVEKEVEKFLKQQRAEVEAKQIPSSSVELVSTNKTLPKPEKTGIAETNNLYKLLPKSKQLEYEKLIQKLKSAEKRPRIRRLSNKTQDSRFSKTRTLKTADGFPNSDCKAQVRSNITGNLQRTWKHMQTQVNGRLQIKGKYHALSPLMKKLNEVSQQQKKHEMQIKHLLNQLKEAKIQSQKSQQIFHDLLKDFLKKKEEIDNRLHREKVLPHLPVTYEPEKKLPVEKNKPSALLVSEKFVLPQHSQSNFKCKIVVETCLDNLTNPNDIKFKSLENVESGMPKYTSPLDNKESISNKINPLEILCPFEINGSCRDKECTYNHCI